VIGARAKMPGRPRSSRRCSRSTLRGGLTVSSGSKRAATRTAKEPITACSVRTGRSVRLTTPWAPWRPLRAAAALSGLAGSAGQLRLRVPIGTRPGSGVLDAVGAIRFTHVCRSRWKDRSSGYRAEQLQV